MIGFFFSWWIFFPFYDIESIQLNVRILFGKQTSTSHKSWHNVLKFSYCFNFGECFLSISNRRSCEDTKRKWKISKDIGIVTFWFLKINLEIDDANFVLTMDTFFVLFSCMWKKKQKWILCVRSFFVFLLYSSFDIWQTFSISVWHFQSKISGPRTRLIYLYAYICVCVWFFVVVLFSSSFYSCFFSCWFVWKSIF